MLARWWERQAMVGALFLAVLAIRLQTSALQLRDLSVREAGALYLLLYVGAFWVGLVVRWLDGRGRTLRKAE
jgi:hypothetical protein